jgi:predicted NBD/HSP70 family sugar kinase
VLKAFKGGRRRGGMATLVELLDPEAVYVGGGKVTVARRPVRGAKPIACWQSG